MFPRITHVVPLGACRLELTFTDGVRGQVDLAEWVVGQGGVFEPLENPEFFCQVRVNAELGTIQWPNDVDFCPDVLYSRVTGTPIPFAQSESAGIWDLRRENVCTTPGRISR
jgi:hypothetical protein